MRTWVRLALAAALGAGSLFAAALRPASTQDEEALSPAEWLPPHRVSVKPLDLRRAPSAAELMAAGQLGGPLFPTHQLADRQRDQAARLAFAQAIDQWNRHEYEAAVARFRRYEREFPDSPWTGEATLHIGCDASYHGRYTEAEESFQKLIARHQGSDHPGARMLVNKARQRLALLRIEQNNLDEAALQFRILRAQSPDWRQRTYSSHWLQRLSRFTAAGEALVNCGVEALAYTLEKEGQHAAAAAVRTNLPPTMRGHTLASLARLAAVHGLEPVVLRLDPGELAQLPLPAILQIQGRTAGDPGHYWVLDQIRGNRLELFDPQSQRRFSQTPEELTREWSGKTLAFFRGGPWPGQRLAGQEIEEDYGGCCGVPAKEDNLGDPCRNGANGDSCSDCSQGAPIWTVDMVNLNLFVTDTPLWYNPPVGPALEIRLSYNSQSAIAQHEPFGGKWQFNYASYLVVDPAGTVLVFMPDGRRDVFSPDGAGGYRPSYRVHNTLTRLGPDHFELRFPDDRVYGYQIPPGTSSQQPFLVEIRDAYEQKLSLSYDSEVRLTTIRDAQGLVTTLGYSPQNLVTHVTDPFGRQARFEYDGEGRLAKVTDMGGYWAGFSYDADLNLTGISNERGQWTFRIEPADGINNGSQAYPPPGGTMYENYRITVTDPLGQSSEYHYNGYSAYSWYVSPRDYLAWHNSYENNFSASVPKTVYQFTTAGSGRQGEIRRITKPEGDSVEFEYDVVTGDQIGMSDAHGHTWQFTYNAQGNLTSVIDARDASTVFVYATNGVDLLGIVDGRGQARMTYDAQHRLTSVTDWLGGKTTFAYNTLGQLTERVDPLGSTNQYRYDPTHRLVEISQAGLLTDSFTYDSIGRIRTQTDAAGLELTFDYNNLNQVTRVTYPDGRFVEYTYSTCCPRLLDSVTDRGGRTRRFEYDSLKRLTSTVNPEGGMTRYEHDANGNRTGIVDPNGNRTTFVFDANNRLVRKTYADGKSMAYSYDVGGLLTSRVNARGIVATYAYDENHRLTSVSYSDGTPGFTNTLDAFDRVVSRRDGLGTSRYTYDANSHLVSADGPWSNDTVTCGSDAQGRRTNVTVQGGTPVRYAYDVLNRLVEVRIGAASYRYEYEGASPLVQTLRRAEGSTTTYRYDAVKRLVGLSNRRSTGETVSEFLYAYDDRDTRSSETVSNALAFTVASNRTTLRSYNVVNQITNAMGDQTFAYDDDGNLTRGLTPNGDPFVATYDAENRLRSLVFTNANHAHRLEYSYYGSGVLAEIKEYTDTVLSKDTRLVRDRTLVLEERDGQNATTRAYTWGLGLGGGIGGLLHLSQNGGDYSYLYDGNGNVVALLDTAQAMAAAYRYDPFGRLLARAGSLDQPMGFSTRASDDATGLVSFPFRWYSAALGRWLTRDPLGEASGLNAYAFVQNNPIQRIDPLGLWSAHPGKPPKDAAATIVCDGAGGIRIKWLFVDPDILESCVRYCIEEHEKSHMDDALNANPTICAGADNGTIVWADYPLESALTEFKAHEAEKDCLNRAKEKGLCDNERVDHRIERVNEGIKDLIQQLFNLWTF